LVLPGVHKSPGVITRYMLHILPHAVRFSAAVSAGASVFACTSAAVERQTASLHTVVLTETVLTETARREESSENNISSWLARMESAFS